MNKHLNVRESISGKRIFDLESAPDGNIMIVIKVKDSFYRISLEEVNKHAKKMLCSATKP